MRVLFIYVNVWGTWYQYYSTIYNILKYIFMYRCVYIYKDYESSIDSLFVIFFFSLSFLLLTFELVEQIFGTFGGWIKMQTDC